MCSKFFFLFLRNTRIRRTPAISFACTATSSGFSSSAAAVSLTRKARPSTILEMRHFPGLRRAGLRSIGAVVDITQPDICYIGGLTRALRVAKMAEQAGLPCVPHSANHSLVTVFTLHMMGAIPNAGPHVEFSIEPTPWARDLYTPVLEAVDGRVMIPDGPGWGVTINLDWLARAERQVSQSE